MAHLYDDNYIKSISLIPDLIGDDITMLTTSLTMNNISVCPVIDMIRDNDNDNKILNDILLKIINDPTCNVNICDHRNDSLLSWLLYTRNCTIVKELLNKRCDINLNATSNTGRGIISNIFYFRKFYCCCIHNISMFGFNDMCIEEILIKIVNLGFDDFDYATFPEESLYQNSITFKLNNLKYLIESVKDNRYLLLVSYFISDIVKIIQSY